MLIYHYETGQLSEVSQGLWDSWQEQDNPKAIGWLQCPEAPDYTPATQHPPRWDTEAKAWVVADKTPQEIDAETRALYPDAERYQVMEWLIRNGIQPEQIEGIIQQAVTDPTEQAVALMRWRSVTRVPFTHPLVQLVASQLQIDLAEQWPTILAY